MGACNYFFARWRKPLCGALLLGCTLGYAHPSLQQSGNVIPGTAQLGWTNTPVQTRDFRRGADYLQVSRYGVACDANHTPFNVTLTSGSPLVNVGSLFGTEAIGKVMTFGQQTGYGYQSAQNSWVATIVGYTYPNATLSANAPFNFTGVAQYGTLNTANLQAALNDANYAFPLTIPTGCKMLTGPLHWNNSQSIIGQHMQFSGFVGLPGQPILVQPEAARITSWSIDSNVVTFQAANSFVPNDTVALSRFATSTFFNGTSGQVLATGLSPTQFAMNVTHANGSGTETGLAVPSNDSTAGTRLENIHFSLDSSVDPSRVQGGPWTIYDQAANATTQAAVYHPLYTNSALANNPLAPGWAINAINGVASTTQNSAVICYSTATGQKAPVAGQTIVFPYMPAVFTSTVSSLTGMGCSGATAPATMAAPLPNITGYTVAQAEWISTHSVQTTTTTIVGTPSYPFTIQLSNSTAPVPGFESNFAQHGHAKIGSYEFDYMGVNLLTNMLTIRRGPARVNGGAGYSGTNTIVPLNPCPAKNLFGSGADQPWPVIPSVNTATITSWSISRNVATFRAANSFTAGQTGYLAGFPNSQFFNGVLVTVLSAGLSSTQFEVAFTAPNGSATESGTFNNSTPSGANWFPGECGGAAAIFFPESNANVYVGTGLSSGFLENLSFDAGAVENANGTMGISEEGNNASYGTDYGGIKMNGLMFGIVQGPAEAGQHGVGAVGPTSTGNRLHNLSIFGVFPLAFADMQQSYIDGADTYSTEMSPYDGSAIGTATCLFQGNTYDEQNGGNITITAQNKVTVWNCEPENGSHIEVLPYAESDGFNLTYDSDNFESVPNFFAGANQTVTNSILSVPTVNYGNNNDFEDISSTHSTYFTNVWDGRAQFFNWGTNSRCGARAGGSGPETACGGGFHQGYSGRSMEAAKTGNFTHPYENALGGQILTGEWNTNPTLDALPMSVGFTVDPTEPYWGSYAACNLGGAAACRVSAFDASFGSWIFVGPHNRIVDGPYVLEANFKTVAAASSFQINVAAFDSGTGQCSSSGIITSPTVSTTTSWAHSSIPVDFTGKAGCVLTVQFYKGTTTDQLRVGEFDFVPVPQRVLAPVASPTEGAACPTPGAILGSDSSYLYICSAGVVKRAAIN